MELSHSVHPIRQPNLNDCWATAIAMVLGFDGIQGVNRVKNMARSVHLNPNGSIPSASIPALANATRTHILNMNSPLQLLSVPVLRQVLATSVAAGFGSYNYPGARRATMHVLLFYRVTGDDQDPMVYFVDPYTGHHYNYLVDEINEALGSVDYFLYR